MTSDSELQDPAEQAVNRADILGRAIEYPLGVKVGSFTSPAQRAEEAVRVVGELKRERSAQRGARQRA